MKTVVYKRLTEKQQYVLPSDILKKWQTEKYDMH